MGAVASVVTGGSSWRFLKPTSAAMPGHRGCRATPLRVPTHRRRGAADARARDRSHAAWVRTILVPVTVALALAVGLALRLAGEARAAHVLWVIVLTGVIAPLAVAVVRRMLHGQ